MKDDKLNKSLKAVPYVLALLTSFVPNAVAAFNNEDVADFIEFSQHKPQIPGRCGNGDLGNVAFYDFETTLKQNPNNWQTFQMRANAYLERDNYADAKKDYDQVLKINPQNAYAYERRALTRSLLQDLPGAISDYNKALELNPQESDILIRIAHLYMLMDDYPKAIESYQQFLSKYPNQNVGNSELANIGKAYFMIGDNKKAVDLYNRELASCNRFHIAKIYFLRELTAYLKEDRQKTIEHCRHILGLDHVADLIKKADDGRNANGRKTIGLFLRPDADLPALKQLAVAYQLSGQTSEAITLCGAAIRMHDDAEAYRIRALMTCLAQMNKADQFGKEEAYKAAIDEISEAIKKQPEDLKCHMLRAYINISFNKDKDSIQDLNFVLERDPKNIEALLTRAHEQQWLADTIPGKSLETKNYSASIADYKKILAISPNRVDILKQLAYLYGRQGDSKIALDYNSKISALDANNPVTLCATANHYRDSRQYKEQIEYLNKAIALDPQNARIYYDRALAKVYLDDIKGSVEDCTKSLSLVKSVLSYKLRAAAHAALGDYADAINDYGHAIELSPDKRRLYLERSLLYSLTDNYKAALYDQGMAAVIRTDGEYNFRLGGDEPEGHVHFAGSGNNFENLQSLIDARLIMGDFKAAQSGMNELNRCCAALLYHLPEIRLKEKMIQRLANE